MATQVSSPGHWRPPRRKGSARSYDWRRGCFDRSPLGIGRRLAVRNTGSA
jgi:hypothetical protein